MIVIIVTSLRQYCGCTLGQFHDKFAFLRLDSNNLFKYKDTGKRIDPPKRFCSCSTSPSGDSISKCDSISAKPSDQDNTKKYTQLVPAIAVQGKNIAKTVVLPDVDGDYDFEPEEPPKVTPGWPTASGRTKQQVEAYCIAQIKNSASGKICSIIPDFPIDQYIQQCIVDIKVSHSYSHVLYYFKLCILIGSIN